MNNITERINPRNRTEQIGLPATRGGVVVPGDELIPGAGLFTIDGSTTPEFCKLIVVGVAGDVIVETADGLALFFPAQVAGDYIPVVGARVLIAHTFPVLGGKTTTATELFWLGGI